MKKQDTKKALVKKLRDKYFLYTHKVGIEFPMTTLDALVFEKMKRNIKWSVTIAKEMNDA